MNYTEEVPEKMFVFKDIVIFALPPTATMVDLLMMREFIDDLIRQEEMK